MQLTFLVVVAVALTALVVEQAMPEPFSDPNQEAIGNPESFARFGGFGGFRGFRGFGRGFGRGYDGFGRGFGGLCRGFGGYGRSYYH